MLGIITSPGNCTSEDHLLLLDLLSWAAFDFLNATHRPKAWSDARRSSNIYQLLADICIFQGKKAAERTTAAAAALIWDDQKKAMKCSSKRFLGDVPWDHVGKCKGHFIVRWSFLKLSIYVYTYVNVCVMQPEDLQIYRLNMHNIIEH